MPRRQDNPYAPHDWAPHEKPALLGSPSTPLHSPAKRLAYGVVGLQVGGDHCVAQRAGETHQQTDHAVGVVGLLVCLSCRVPSPPGRQKSPGCRRYT